MTDPVNLHEDLRREHRADPSSPRAFGLLFAVVFLIVGAAPLLGGDAPRWWGLASGCVFGLLALIAPAALAPLSDLWLTFGALLRRVVSPIVMVVLFVGAVVPTGLLMRLLGRDSLALKREPSKMSYWIDRTPPGPEPESLRQQF